MVVVSQIMRYYKVNSENINTDHFWIRLISDIKRSLVKQQTLDNKILVIKLQEVSADDNTMIPKLEHKKI